MAHFYGTVQGGRGVASRLGHATTGLFVTAQSYTGDVIVQLDVRNGVDWVYLSVKPHGAGPEKVIYHGPIATLLSQSGRKTLVEEFAKDFMTGELEAA